MTQNQHKPNDRKKPVSNGDSEVSRNLMRFAVFMKLMEMEANSARSGGGGLPQAMSSPHRGTDDGGHVCCSAGLCTQTGLLPFASLWWWMCYCVLHHDGCRQQWCQPAGAVSSLAWSHQDEPFPWAPNKRPRLFRWYRDLLSSCVASKRSVLLVSLQFSKWRLDS